MATKTKAPKAKTAKKAKKDMQKVEKGGNQVMIILAVVAVLVIASIVLFVAMEDGEKEGKLANAPSFSEISTESMESMEKVDEFIAIGTISINMGSSSGQQDQSMEMTSDMEIRYDKAEKEMYSRMDMDMGGMAMMTGTSEQSVESYIINDTTYTKSKDPYGSGDYWIKQELAQDIWVDMDLDFSEFMDLVNGEVVAEEKKNGKDTYKVVVTPDIERIIEYMMSTQGDIGVYDQEALDDAIMHLTDSIEKVDMSIWVTKDESFPVAIEGEMLMSLDLSQLYGMPGSLELDIDMDMDVDYDSPVEIELPDEAKNATGINSLYRDSSMSRNCGDGYCDWNEDSTSCPEDCYCGDGWCDPYENKSTCAEDCEYNTTL
jgi:hypothetical protein